MTLRTTNNRITATHEAAPAFDVDGMLAGLAKWLRILGCDAAYPRPKPTGPHRIFVTTALGKARAGDVIVPAGQPLQQLVELLRQIEMEPDETLFFSRCILCNEPVAAVPREEVHGKVPEAIFLSGRPLYTCPTCGRVYWEGSHLHRVKRRLEALKAADS